MQEPRIVHILLETSINLDFYCDSGRFLARKSCRLFLILEAFGYGTWRVVKTYHAKALPTESIPVAASYVS